MNYQTIIENRLQKLTQNLAEDFVIGKLSKSPSRFNLGKLEWFNKEYLKMMSLEEFCFRVAQLKVDKKYKNAKLSSESAVLIVDFETQKIFISQIIPKNKSNLPEVKVAKNVNLENNFEYINLKEMTETLQKTGEKTDFDPQKLIPILKIQKLQETEKLVEKSETGELENKTENKTEIEEIQNVLETTFLLYPEKCENLEEYCFEIQGEFENYTISRKWINLDEIISKNGFLTYPLWSDFCKVQNLPCFEPNLTILTQFLAHNLDKNRVAKLSEVG